MATKTNQYGQTYSGNDDFRGWIAGGGAGNGPYGLGLTGAYGPLNAKGTADLLLKHLGNDGRSGNAEFDKAGQSLYKKWVSGRTGQSSQDNAYITGLQRQMAALQQQLAYQPKLPTFDVLGNYNRARSTAESAVNPLYQKYLTDFLAAQQMRKGNKQQETELAKQANATNLSQTLAESAVNRGRAAEDTATAIGQLNVQEGQMQQDTGTQFDIDRRAAAEANAASGLTTSGIGRNNMFVQEEQRNISEDRQVKEFENQRQAKQLFKSRTFEDLARGDENAKTISSQRDASAQFDLDSYLEELAAEETQYRLDNEVKRLGDINSQTQTYASQGTQAFLASLAGAGWRPQDIALAYQVYG